MAGMAADILSVTELWNGRSAGERDSAEREYERVFQVLTSSNLIAGGIVTLATGIPRRWDPYITTLESDTGALCRDVHAEQDQDDPTVWKVTAKFSSKAGGHDQKNKDHPDQQDKDPAARPAIIEWRQEMFQRAIMEPPDGVEELPGQPAALTNSANDYYDPPIEIDDSRPTLTVTRNENDFDDVMATRFTNAINKDSVWGYLPGKWKCQGIQSTREYEEGKFFYKVIYTFHYRDDGWDLKILDQGYNELGDAGLDGVRPRRAIFDEINGTPISCPVLLDGNGKRLPNKAGNAPQFRTYAVYRKLNFIDLHLP